MQKGQKRVVFIPFFPYCIKPQLYHASVLKFEKKSLYGISQDHVEYISGHAVFTPEGNVKVGENIYTAKHILIACGGRPLIPNMPGGLQKSEYRPF